MQAENEDSKFLFQMSLRSLLLLLMKKNINNRKLWTSLGQQNTFFVDVLDGLMIMMCLLSTA
jgi:hypothetical protein